MSASTNFTLSVRKSLSAREWALAGVASFLAAAAVVTPFFFFGMASGHDIAFHMASWLDAAGQWKQGIWLPRWTEWANFGYGEPRFIFYPPLSWMVGAFLGTLIPWKYVGIAFLICSQTVAGLSAYALLRRLTDSVRMARLGSVCFALNPYALTIIYARSDFAELLAIAFFPILLLMTLRLCGLIPEGSHDANLPRFAFAFCAVWLSNAPAAVIATYSVTLIFVFSAVRQRTFSALRNGAAGILWGFALPAFYLIPAICEQKWVNISGALAGGLDPAKNFLYARTADSEHDLFNRIASNVAVVIIAWAALGACLDWRARRREADTGSRLRGLLSSVTILCVAGTVMMLPLTAGLWRYLPELRFVQFPWRWMSIVATCAVIFTTATAKGRLQWIWLLVATGAIAGSGAYLGNNTWWDTEDMPSLQAALQDGSGFEGTDEYDPKGDDHTDLPQRYPQAKFVPGDKAQQGQEKVVIEKWTAEHRLLRTYAHEPSRVAVRLVDYPAWSVSVNGSPTKVEHAPGTAQMIVSVPAGQSQIEIKFSRTADRTIGGWVSVVTVCFSLGWIVHVRRQS
jgi:hypothetical protein